MENFKEYFSPEDLNQLKNQPQNLPQFRGPKENSPDTSNAQQQQNEIHDIVKGYIGVLKEERIVRKGSLSTACWDSESSTATVTSQKGSYWNYFGKKIQDKIMLNAEETLYLVDQGCLELFYGGVPLSVQQIFSMVLPPSFPLHHYLVYAYLLRLGYIVCRHQQRLADNDEEQASSDVTDIKTALKQMSNNESSSTVSLVQPKDATTTASILSKLQVIKSYNKKTSEPSPTLRPSHKVDFDVYLPGSHFKKSNPGKPAFCISVCRYSDNPPSLAELMYLTHQCHPIPLKFAVTDHGSVTINSLMPVELPVSITKG